MFAFSTKTKFSSKHVNELGETKNNINIIDIREAHEYQRGFVPGAKSIPMSTLLSKPEKYLDITKEYHVICQSGGRSLNACHKLSTLGYNVINVSGGTGSYNGTLER